jgi:DNA-binding XRE family transcriptional regulator
MHPKALAKAKSKSRSPVELDDADRYDPVPFDPKKHAAEMREKCPEFRAAYDALEEEFATLDVLLNARASAGLTFEQVAERMGISEVALGRIQGSLAKQKPSPSLATLRRYAAACGKKLVIRMI